MTTPATPTQKKTKHFSKGYLDKNVSLDCNSFQVKDWGLPKFHLEHKECIFKYHQACVYEDVPSRRKM